MTEKEGKAIEYLKRLPDHLYRMDYKDICIDLDSHISSLPIPTIKTDKIYRFEETSQRDCSVVYRARENETYIPEKGNTKLPFKSINEISIIPEHKKSILKHFGRCNKPLEPRFYCSNDARTACIEAMTKGFEKDVTTGKFLTVSAWKITEPVLLAQINLSEKFLNNFFEYDKRRYSEMLNTSKLFNMCWINQIMQRNQFSKDYIQTLFEIFADEFARTDVQSDYDYKLTNYYCDHVFERINSPQVDGILYPSVSFSYQEWNLAIHPRALNKLQFLNAMMVWVVYHGQSGNIEFNPLEEQINADENGNLQWKSFNW